MLSFLNWLFTFQGRVNQKQYFGSGLVLLALKFALDSFVASRFQYHWKITNYLYPPRDSTVLGLAGPHRTLYLILLDRGIPDAEAAA